MPRVRREVLTEARRAGCNALGVLELAACFAPAVAVEAVIGAIAGSADATPQGIGTLGRVALLIGAIGAGAFDLRWRWREEPDPRWWVKAGSADAGGAMALGPGWMVAVVIAAIAIFALLTVGDSPSPYAR